MLSLIVISLLLTPIFCDSQLSNELLDQLLDRNKYDPRIRPGNQTAADVPTIVRTNTYIRGIEYICTKDQEWKVQITFRQQWNDPRLRYNDNNRKVNYLITMDEDRIWRPDIFFSNSRSTERMVDIAKNVLIRIYPNGNVLYSIRLQTVLSCPMDLKYYPFDKQICSLRMASYGFTTNDLVFLWKEGDPVQVTKNLHLPDFTLEKYLTDYCTSRTNTGEYSCLKVDFQFKRESSKYICKWFAPTAVLTIISFLSFWLKPKSTRIKLLTVTLILLYLHILYINNKASPNTRYTNSMDRWLSTCLCYVVAAIVELAIVKVLDRIFTNRNSTEYLGLNVNSEKADVAVKPQVIERKCNGLNPRNIVQTWRKSSIGRRIDIFSGLLFPLAFVIYISCFFTYAKRLNEETSEEMWTPYH